MFFPHINHWFKYFEFYYEFYTFYAVFQLFLYVYHQYLILNYVIRRIYYSDKSSMITLIITYRSLREMKGRLTFEKIYADKNEKVNCTWCIT